MKVVVAGVWRRVDTRVKLGEKAKEAIISGKQSQCVEKTNSLRCWSVLFRRGHARQSSNFVYLGECMLTLSESSWKNHNKPISEFGWLVLRI
jgi:hypothetical protein